ncbi:MAG: hypothetical protein Q4B60_05350 [Erysipelotrichaceae bacterium]|nr:hypothetical protein [Erysipelotrichaceae bacterium]
MKEQTMNDLKLENALLKKALNNMIELVDEYRDQIDEKQKVIDELLLIVERVVRNE